MVNYCMVKIRVSATSANLGPGFDCIGVALNIYNNVWFKQSDNSVLITDGSTEKISSENIYYKSVKSVFDLCGEKFYGIEVVQKPSIPAARGLGSSSACIVSGIYGANMLLGNPLKQDDLIDLAAKLEGHPDNTTPCIVGGLCCCVVENDKVYYSSVPVDNSIMFCAFVPDFKMPTKEARRILPQGITHIDAAYNISRAAYLMSLFYKKDYSRIGIALKDKLHQPYRLSLIEGSDEIFKLADDLGAYGTYLSGAGPTIISIVDSKNKDFIKNAKQYLKENLKVWRILTLNSDKKGVLCSYED